MIQPEKALDSMLVTDSGMETEVSPAQDMNARCPIHVTAYSLLSTVTEDGMAIEPEYLTLPYVTVAVAFVSSRKKYMNFPVSYSTSVATGSSAIAINVQHRAAKLNNSNLFICFVLLGKHSINYR